MTSTEQTHGEGVIQGGRLMRFRDLMTLRTPAQVADDVHATEARILAPFDALVIEAREVVERYRAAAPSAFDSRRDRRAGDRPSINHPGWKTVNGRTWVQTEGGGYWVAGIESAGDLFKMLVDGWISEASAKPRIPPFDLTHKRGAGCGGAL